MAKVYDIGARARLGNPQPVDITDRIPGTIARSVKAKWDLGHSPRQIATDIWAEHKLALGDNAVCDLIRLHERLALAEAISKAERRGRLLNWPAVGLVRRAA